MSSGGNWLEILATEQPPFPKGSLFLAFDNNQKSQKSYLNRGFNKVPPTAQLPLEHQKKITVA